MARLTIGTYVHRLEETITTIGSARDVHVSIASPHVSRKHAIVLRDHRGWWIVDFRSANGVAVNGRPVERARLKDGDVITLTGGEGAEAVQLTFGHGPDDPPPPPLRAATRLLAPQRALAQLAPALAGCRDRAALATGVLDALLAATGADRAVLALTGPVRIEDARPLLDRAWTRAREKGPQGFESLTWPLHDAAAVAACRDGRVLYVRDVMGDERLGPRLEGKRAAGITMMRSVLMTELVHAGVRYGLMQLDARITSPPLPEHAAAVAGAVRGAVSLALAALHAREA